MACNDRQLAQSDREAAYQQQRTGVVQALRPFSGAATIENLLDYLNRELVPAVRNGRNAINDVYLQVADNAPSANPLAYYFSTSVAAGDPTVGRIKLNASPQDTATVIRVSQSNARLQDVTPWLDVMSGGPTTPLGTVTLVDAINPTRFLRFDLNTMVDSGAYWDLGVTIIEGSHDDPFVEGEAVALGFIAGVSAAGSTVPVGSLSPVANDTFLGNVSGAAAPPSAVDLSTLAGAGLAFAAHTLDVTGSTSITIASDQVRRAALTGEATAPVNDNAVTVTRSTNFQSSPWTGDHQFNAELRLGTLHSESAVSGALNVTLTAGATRLLITSTADVTLGTISGCADGRVLIVEHARSSGTGHLIVTHGTGTNAIACPGDHNFPVRGRGNFVLVGRSTNWKLIERDTDKLALQTDAGGGGNNFSLEGATNLLLVTSNATYTGFARAGGNDDGDRFFIQCDAGIEVSLPFNSGSSSSGNRVSGQNAITYTIRSRGLVELIYRDSLWRIINIADVFTGTANTFTAANTFSAAVTLGAQVSYTGLITPSNITADTDDYTPTGWSAANLVRLSTDGTSATVYEVTGAGAGSSGEVKWLVNLGPGQIRLRQDTSSSAANRWVLTSGTTFTINANGVVGILYDGTSSRWRPIAN